MARPGLNTEAGSNWLPSAWVRFPPSGPAARVSVVRSRLGVAKPPAWAASTPTPTAAFCSTPAASCLTISAKAPVRLAGSPNPLARYWSASRIVLTVFAPVSASTAGIRTVAANSRGLKNVAFVAPSFSKFSATTASVVLSLPAPAGANVTF